MENIITLLLLHSFNVPYMSQLKVNKSMPKLKWKKTFTWDRSSIYT